MSYDSVNTSRRLPIVFCVDVSPSMNTKATDVSYSRMDLANRVINVIVDELRKNNKAWSAAEIAVVTFTEKIIRNDMEFQPISSFSVPTFSTVSPGGTNLANAIMTSIEKLENIKSGYISHSIRFYLPFLILITDGNTDQNEDSQRLELAIKAIHEHCVSHGNGDNIIIPYVIGVGSGVEEKTLNKMAELFMKKAIIIDDDMMRNEEEIISEVLQLIGSSITKSVNLSTYAASYKQIARKAKTVTEKLEERRRKIL